MESERYLELCLRLGRHVDGLVDAYYGPAEIAAAGRRRGASRSGRARRGRGLAARVARRRRLARRAARRARDRRPQARRRGDPVRGRGRALLRRAAGMDAGRVVRSRSPRARRAASGRRARSPSATRRGARARLCRATRSRPSSEAVTEDFRSRTAVPLRASGGRVRRGRLRLRRALDRVQLLPGRPAQPDRRQHRRAR